ncbi:MAG: class I SAM-dependent methyltransferase [Methanosarcinales archaeon]|nr:class I SAM-dependent methyltransferase [Methanosarcinales archaeon]
MVKPRIPETDQGVQGEFIVEIYDKMSRKFRDRKLLQTNQIIKAGLTHGLALEIGPGPGYLGLEWLKKTDKTNLMLLEISPDMITFAKKNTREYGFESRVKYVLGNALIMPFNDNMFNSLFTSASLHEWSHPNKVFNEIHRILKPGGRFYITDLRRDMNPVVKCIMKIMVKEKELKSGLISSINAAYTIEEVRSILDKSKFNDHKVTQSVFGLDLTGVK